MIKRVLVELGLWTLAGLITAVALMWIMDVLR